MLGREKSNSVIKIQYKYNCACFQSYMGLYYVEVKNLWQKLKTYRKLVVSFSSRDSSVGRALDWRSKGPWFDPGSRQFNCSNNVEFSSLLITIKLIKHLLFLNCKKSFIIKKRQFKQIFVRILTHENFTSLQLGARRNIKRRQKTLHVSLWWQRKFQQCY